MKITGLDMTVTNDDPEQVFSVIAWPTGVKALRPLARALKPGDSYIFLGEHDIHIVRGVVSVDGEAHGFGLVSLGEPGQRWAPTQDEQDRFNG